MSSKTMILAFGLGILAGGCLMRSTTAVENRAVKGVLAGLRAGQPVVLKDLGTAYEVSTMGGEKTGTQVVEVGGRLPGGQGRDRVSRDPDPRDLDQVRRPDRRMRAVSRSFVNS
jgi:hypothetical protein